MEYDGAGIKRLDFISNTRSDQLESVIWNTLRNIQKHRQGSGDKHPV
jgi:hypothetical protein